MAKSANLRLQSFMFAIMFALSFEKNSSADYISEVWL